MPPSWLVSLSSSEEEPEDEKAQEDAAAAEVAPLVLRPAPPASPPPPPPPVLSPTPPAHQPPGAKAPYAEAVGRLIFMSWNPGAGARRLAEVIDTSGYHVVAVQEAREDILSTLDPQRWSYAMNYQQFLGARCPNRVESHCGEDTKNRIRWHFATVHFNPQRVNRHSLGIMSLHLNNVHAKKPQAGYLEVGIAIDKACKFSSSHTVDVVCGDLNMARWSKSLSADQASQWHEGTLGELEKRGYIPVADYSEECCFVAVHDSIAQTLHIKGSSWGERAKTLDPDQQTAFGEEFLEKVGAKKTSHDVHWPMSLAIRMPTSARASGLRQRSAAAIERRNEKKRKRGFLPSSSSASAATYSGSAAPAAPVVGDYDSGWHGRSSGSATSSSSVWHNDWGSHGRSSGSAEWSGWRGRSSGSAEWSGWHGRSSGSAEWSRRRW